MAIRDRKLSLWEMERRTGIPLRCYQSKRGKKPGRYVASMPLWLAEGAARLPGRSLHVVVAVWHWQRLTGSGNVALTRRKLAQFGMTRHALRRSLEHLEAAGLAMVQRAPNRAPRVTIPSKRPRGS